MAAFLRLPRTVGIEILGQHHQHTWAFVSHFGHLGSGGVLKPHMCGVKREIGGPNRPHDAHDAGSLGAAGRLKCAINPNTTLKIHAVGSVCGCKYQ